MASKLFELMVDELCIYSENDIELKQALLYIDEKAFEKGISIYDMIHEFLYKRQFHRIPKGEKP